MKKKKFKTESVRVTFLTTKETHKIYKKFCINNEIVMSDRIRELIEKDIGGEIK